MNSQTATVKLVPRVRKAKSSHDITVLLSQWANPEARACVIEKLYNELHRMASIATKREVCPHSWQSSDVLNEAIIRLLRAKKPYNNREHFFGAASRAMQHVLVDGARKRKAVKRGGRMSRVDFDVADRFGFDKPDERWELHLALDQLASSHPLWFVAAELRICNGYSTKEIAAELGCGLSTARRYWAHAQRWLTEVFGSRQS